MSYQDEGYNFLLGVTNPLDLSNGINTGNADAFFAAGSIEYDATNMATLYPNQDMQSKNFDTGVEGWRIRGDGTAEFVGLTLSGGIIKYQKTSFTDSVNSGYYIGSEGLYFGSAGDASILKFNIATGALDYTGDVGGRGASTIASAINSSAQATDVTNGLITSLKLANDAVTASKLAVAAIDGTSGNLAVNSVVTASIQAGAVTADEIFAGSITSAKMATGALDAYLITGATIRTDSGSYPKVNLDSAGIKIHGSNFELRDTAGTLYGYIGGYGGYFNVATTSGRNMQLSASGGTIYCADEIAPLNDNTQDLGNSSFGWRRLYLGGSGRYLEDNGGDLYWDSSPVGGGTGTVTSVATSGAITGGTITTSGTISHSTSSGYKHIPSSGSSYQMLRYSSSGTAQWSSDTYADYFRDNGSTTKYMHYSGSSWDFNDSTYTSGDVDAGGTKNFQITDPRDPSKHLRYFATESDEVLLKTRGTTTLSGGTAVVEMPDHWTVVTESDWTVQVTPAGDCMGVYATVDVDNNQIIINELQSGASNAPVNWEVTATRKGYLNHPNVVSRI